ncbi:MAG: hypothetical protein ABII88_06300 [Candidatus Omnitrophota bacterium]
MKNKRSGIALILAVGILCILAMVAVGFSVVTKVELKSSTNFASQLKAQYIAEAGIARAIEELKYGAAGVKQHPYDTEMENWFYKGNNNPDPVGIDLKDATHPSFDNLNGALGDSISQKDFLPTSILKLKVLDCASLININTSLASTSAETGLKNMLIELGLNSTQTQELIDYRNAGNKFSTKEEVKNVFSSGAVPAYNRIKDFITLYGVEDTGADHTEMTFVNINTAPKTVLRAVLNPIMSSSDPETLANAIIARRQANPFDGGPAGNAAYSSALGEYIDFLENQGLIAADLKALKNYTNPNRFEAGVLVTPSTYFSFDGGGNYEIEALASYRGANKRVKTAIKIFKKIYKTTTAEFDAGGEFARVTSKDTCPTKYSSFNQFNYDPATADPIKGALKPGFWDDFEDTAYSTSVWKKVSGLLGFFHDDINNIYYLTTLGALDANPVITIGDKDDLNKKWFFTDFSGVMKIKDDGGLRAGVPRNWREPITPGPPGPVENSNYYDFTTNEANIHQKYMCAGHFIYRRLGESEGTAFISNIQTSTESGWTSYHKPPLPSPLAIEYWMYYKPDLYNLSNKFLLDSEADASPPASVDCTYQVDKTIRLTCKGSNVDATAYLNPSDSLSITKNFTGLPGNGQVAIYGSANRPWVEHIRIIPVQGIYTSPTYDFSTLGAIEWGTISCGVALPDGASALSEQVAIQTKSEAFAAIPQPNDIAIGGYYNPSGGIIAGTNSIIAYRVWMLSGAGTNFEKIPVVEDVTITYMPKTEVLFQSYN